MFRICPILNEVCLFVLCFIVKVLGTHAYFQRSIVTQNVGYKVLLGELIYTHIKNIVIVNLLK